MMHPDNIYEKVDVMQKGLDDFSTFVKWPDNFKRERIELLLGFP